MGLDDRLATTVVPVVEVEADLGLLDGGAGEVGGEGGGEADQARLHAVGRAVVALEALVAVAGLLELSCQAARPPIS